MSIIGYKLEGNMNTPFVRQSNKCHHFLYRSSSDCFFEDGNKKCSVKYFCAGIFGHPFKIRILYSNCNHHFYDILTSNASKFLDGFSLLNTFIALRNSFDTSILQEHLRTRPYNGPQNWIYSMIIFRTNVFA